MFVHSKMPSNVVGVRHSNYEKFISDEPSKMKVLLFSSKPVTPPIFKALSVSSLTKKMVFGVVSEMDHELVKKFGITEFPSVVVIPNPLVEPRTSKGELNYNKLKDMLQKIAQDTSKENIAGAIKLTKHSKHLCPDGEYCVISFLPSETKEAMDTIKESKTRFNNFHFSWVDKNKQTAFERSFPGSPIKSNRDSAALVYNRKRGKYAWASLDSGFKSFLDSVISGDVQWQKLEGDTSAPMNSLV